MPALALLLSGSPAPYAELSIGGGLESNVNHASASADAQEAGYGELSAIVGLDHLDSEEPERTEVWIEAGYDLLWFPVVGDLTSHALSLSVGGAFDPGRDVTISASPFVAVVAYDDSARDALRTGGALGVLFRARPWLHTSIRFHPSVQLARDDVFSSTSVGGTAAVRVLPSDWASALIGYSLSSSDVVLYTSAAPQTVELRRRRGRAVTTFGEETLAVRDRATTHSFLANAKVSAPFGLYALASYTLSQVTSIGSQGYVDHLAALHIGWLLMDASEDASE